MPKRKTWVFGMIELASEQMAMAKKNKMTWSHVRNRLRYGWTIDEAVRLPLRARRERQEIKVKQETKEDRRKAWERRKEQAEKRTDIAVFASEIGISYGVAASCLDSGMSKEKIREKYGHPYEKPTHRWSVKKEATR